MGPLLARASIRNFELCRPRCSRNFLIMIMKCSEIQNFQYTISCETSISFRQPFKHKIALYNRTRGLLHADLQKSTELGGLSPIKGGCTPCSLSSTPLRMLVTPLSTGTLTQALSTSICNSRCQSNLFHPSG